MVGGRFPASEFVQYVVAQVLGGVAAAAVLYLIATGIASTGQAVIRRLRGGIMKPLTGCRPLTLYHKYMGGVDTHDYMRMGSYSLQKTYKMNYWPNTIFLALLDITLVNLYILWKCVHNGAHHMKTREEFYTALAEEMYFYSGFDPIVRTRSFAKAKTPSPSHANLKRPGKQCDSPA